MIIDRRQIAAMIPHSGAMVLLDRVVEWSPESIRCRAVSHRDRANPLRRGGALHAAAGIEYAAQAMAVHGRLVGAVAARPSVGYLASLRQLVIRRERLDEGAGELDVDVTRLSGDAARVLYRFAVGDEAGEILADREAVVLEAGP